MAGQMVRFDPNDAIKLRVLPALMTTPNALMKPADVVRYLQMEIQRIPLIGQILQHEAGIATLVRDLRILQEYGLRPYGPLAEGYIIPRKRGVKQPDGSWLDVYDSSIIIGYKGLMHCAQRSPDVDSIEAHCVYEWDLWDVRLGGDATVEHRPQRAPADEKGNPAPRDASTMVGAYCVSRLTGVSRPIIEWMFIDEIEPMRRRGASGMTRQNFKTGQREAVSTPWDTDYDRMARKTVIRRAINGGSIPISDAAATLAALEEQWEREREIEARTIDAEDIERRARKAPRGLAELTEQMDYSEPIEVREPERVQAEPAAVTEPPAKATTAQRPIAERQQKAQAQLTADDLFAAATAEFGEITGWGHDTIDKIPRWAKARLKERSEARAAAEAARREPGADDDGGEP